MAFETRGTREPSGLDCYCNGGKGNINVSSRSNGGLLDRRILRTPWNGCLDWEESSAIEFAGFSCWLSARYASSWPAMYEWMTRSRRRESRLTTIGSIVCRKTADSGWALSALSEAGHHTERSGLELLFSVKPTAKKLTSRFR